MAKRTKKYIKAIVDQEGVSGTSYGVHAGAVSITDVESQETKTLKFSKCEPGFLASAAAFGILTAAANSGGGAGKGWDDVVARFEMFERNVWTDQSSAGPRITMLIQATFNAFTQAGEEVTIEQIDEKLSAMTNDERTALRANPAVNLELKKLELARKQELLKKATAAVKADAKSDEKVGLPSLG